MNIRNDKWLCFFVCLFVSLNISLIMNSTDPDVETLLNHMLFYKGGVVLFSDTHQSQSEATVGVYATVFRLSMLLPTKQHRTGVFKIKQDQQH